MTIRLRFNMSGVLLGVLAATLAVRALARAGNAGRVPGERLVHGLGPEVGPLAGSLAHELNQPLTAITSNAQAARQYLTKEPLDIAEMVSTLNDIVSDASRASEIVRSVRALVLGHAPAPVLFQVDDVVREVIGRVGDNADGRGVELHRQVPRGLPAAVGDPLEIQLVLFNLLLNAIEAVESVRPRGERRIFIRVERQDDELVLAVRDNGCGVEAGNLQRIFEPFVSSKPKNMGLGLSFSRALAERNGGRLRAIRNEGAPGMTFELRLRMDRAEAPVRALHRVSGVGPRAVVSALAPNRRTS
ncbi:sensor histidine kinase [Cupriavidus sp. H19C3]|uniref:sensor histidine kinase n=1 Tax=Cupriavidus sp. H19C3 TaxID=3241603 RepID=UPI003BF85365